jgi:hypothetical protein
MRQKALGKGQLQNRVLNFYSDQLWGFFYFHGARIYLKKPKNNAMTNV